MERIDMLHVKLALSVAQRDGPAKGIEMLHTMSKAYANTGHMIHRGCSKTEQQELLSIGITADFNITPELEGCFN